MHDTTKKLNKFAISIRAKTAELVFNEIDKFEKIGRELGGFLQARTDTGDPKAPQFDPDMQAQNYKSLQEYKDILNNIYERTASILKDITSARNNH